VTLYDGQKSETTSIQTEAEDAKENVHELEDLRLGESFSIFINGERYLFDALVFSWSYRVYGSNANGKREMICMIMGGERRICDPESKRLGRRRPKEFDKDNGWDKIFQIIVHLGLTNDESYRNIYTVQDEVLDNTTIKYRNQNEFPLRAVRPRPLYDKKRSRDMTDI